jgi:hypothetical protein
MTIQWKGSPNFTKGRGGKRIQYIVIHWFGVGNLDGANSRFQNPTAQVSAHYGISNYTVYQWIKDEDTAWHCGVFKYNQESIGIEHEATTEKNATDTTYKVSSQLVKELCYKYNIPLDREHIIGHKEVKATQCPGTIDIDRIISLAKENTNMTDQEKKDLESMNKLREYNNVWYESKFIIADFESLKAERDSLGKSLSGKDSAITTAQRERDSALAEVKITEDKVSVLEAQLLINQQMRDRLDQEAKKLNSLIDTQSRVIGGYQKRIQELETANRELKNKATQSLTLGDVIKLLWNKISPIKL